MGLRHKCSCPKGLENLSENCRSRFNLTGHALNILCITLTLPGNHRHSHGLLFAWWPQRDNPIGWLQCQNIKKGYPKGLWKCWASTNVHRSQSLRAQRQRGKLVKESRREGERDKKIKDAGQQEKVNSLKGVGLVLQYSLATVHRCVYMHFCLSPLPLFRQLNHSMSYLQVNKHYHVWNETQVRGRVWITIHYHTLTARYFCWYAVWLICICMEIQLWSAGGNA